MMADGSMVLLRLHPLTLPVRLALLVAGSTLLATALEDAHSPNDCRCWAAQGACASNEKFMVPNCAGSCERQKACDALFDAGGPSVLEERTATITQLNEQLARGNEQLGQKDAKISQLEEQLAKSVGEQQAQEWKARINELEAQQAGSGEQQQLLQEKDNRIAQLEEELAKASADRDASSTQVQQEKESQIAQLQEELAKAAVDQKMLKEKDAKIEELSGQLANAAVVEQQLQETAVDQKQLKEKDAKIEELSGQLANAVAVEQQLQEQLAAHDASLLQLKEQNATILQLRAALQTGSAGAEQQLQEKDVTILQLQEQLKQQSSAAATASDDDKAAVAECHSKLNSTLAKASEHESALATTQAAVEDCHANLNNTHATAKELQAQFNEQGVNASERVATLEHALEQMEAANKDLQAGLDEARKEAVQTKEQMEAANKELEASLDEARKQAAGASARLAKLEASAAQVTEKSEHNEVVAKEREERHQQELSKAEAEAASAEARAAELEASSLQREQEAAAAARREMEGDLKRARAAVEDLHSKQSAHVQEIKVCAAKAKQLEQEAERDRPKRKALEAELSEHKQLVETLRSGEAVVPGGADQAMLESLQNANQACEAKTQNLEAQVATLRSTSQRAIEDPPSPLNEAAAAAASEAAGPAAADEGQNCLGASCYGKYAEWVRQTASKRIQDLRLQLEIHGGDAKERAASAWVKLQRSAAETFALAHTKLEPYTRRCSVRLLALKGRVSSRLQQFSPHLDRVSLHLEAVKAAAFAAGYPGSIALLLLTTGLATYLVWRVLYRLLLLVMAIALWILRCIGCCFRRSCSVLCRCCCCCCCCSPCTRRKRPSQAAEGDGSPRKPSTEHFFIGQRDEDNEQMAEPLHEPPPSAGNSTRALPPTGSSVPRPPPTGTVTSPGIGVPASAPRVKAVAAAWPPPSGGITPPSPPMPPPVGSPRQASTATDGTPREFRALDMNLEETVLNRVEGRLERIEGKLGMLMELCSKVPECAAPTVSMDAPAPPAGDMY